MERKLCFFLMTALAILELLAAHALALNVDQVMTASFDSTTGSIKVTWAKNDAEIISALTNSVQNVFDVKHTTTGVPANGIGAGLTFTQETSAANNEIGMILQALTTDTTGGSEDFDFVLLLMDSGAAAAERFRIDSDGLMTLRNGGLIDNTSNGTIALDEPSAATNTAINILTLKHSTSGVANTGIGTGIALHTEDAGGATQISMSLQTIATDATAASEDNDFVVNLIDAGSLSERFRVTSDGVVTLSNAATIDNSTNNTVTITEPAIYLNGAVKNATCTIADGDATPDVTGCRFLTTSANTGPTAITDLDNPVVGAVYCIIGGSATNSTTIADAGNFALSAGWTAAVDDNICLFVQADNDYIEVSRVDN